MNIKRLVASTLIGFATIGTAYADTAGIEAEAYWKRGEAVQVVQADAQSAVQQNANRYNFSDYSR